MFDMNFPKGWALAATLGAVAFATFLLIVCYIYGGAEHSYPMPQTYAAAAPANPGAPLADLH